MSVAHCVHESVKPRIPPSQARAEVDSLPCTATVDPADEFREFLRTSSTMQRIIMEREGVPARVAAALFLRMGTTPVEFRQITGIPKASLARKLKEEGMIAGGGGQAIICLIDTINQAEAMLNADGDEIARGFDVFAWLGRWIRGPQRALAGLTPIQMIDTPTGREAITRVVGAMQSGVYL